MNKKQSSKMLRNLMLRLLPIQVVLASISSINGIVSSVFANNYVGVDAMSAVGLYFPINMLANSISTILVGGSAIICGKYMGQNDLKKLQNVFSVDLILASGLGLLFSVLFFLGGVFDLTGFITKDAIVRPIFNTYLIGMSLGAFPMLVGNQLPVFLSLENRGRRTTVASVTYILVNILLNLIFVASLKMEALGLALAAALGYWVFLLIQLQYFFSKEALLKISFHAPDFKEGMEIFKVGIPGALTYVYQTVRGLMLNRMIEASVGTVGISAFATCNNFLAVFWAIPSGMLAVSRLMMSIAVGEEDTQTLGDVMRVVYRVYLPLLLGVDILLCLLAVPITRIFYRDPGQIVYGMTLTGFRILPFCMPMSTIMLHIMCYGQASNKQFLVHLLSLLDGVADVVAISALLIKAMGINAVYIANFLNGVVTTIVIYGYAWIKNGHFPRTMEELLVIPKDFGVSENERMDLSINNMDDVMRVSKEVQQFCYERGIDKRRAYLSGLAMEEMAGNIVEHGFIKDNKKHSIDARVVHKNDDVILRLKDDCIKFDPHDRDVITGEGDEALMKNVGIRMIFSMASDITYQNALGLNVLTVRI